MLHNLTNTLIFFTTLNHSFNYLYIQICHEAHVCSVMSDSCQPHGLESTRLFCLWNFPDKNTGMDCHSFLQGIIPKWKSSCSVMSDSLQPHGLQPTRLLRPWDFPGKSTGEGCHCLLQGIVPSQGSDPSLLCLLTGRHIHLPLSHLGSLYVTIYINTYSIYTSTCQIL